MSFWDRLKPVRSQEGVCSMNEATLIISSKNYSSWSLRGWLITRMSRLPFHEKSIALDDASTREELLRSDYSATRCVHVQLSRGR
jgi:hypothetical protein